MNSTNYSEKIEDSRISAEIRSETNNLTQEQRKELLEKGMKIIMNENIKTNPNYVDERGSIEMIAENCSVGSISRITSLPNTERANHTHFGGEGHTIVVNEGQIHIYERSNGTNEIPILTVLNKGDIHFTPEKSDHCMFFPTFTVFDCYSVLPRNSASYEKNTVRLGYSLKDIYEEMTRGCGCR